MRSPAPLAAAALIAMSLLAPGASAQRVSLGVVVGGYANDDFDSKYLPRPSGYPPDVARSESGGYVVGSSLDFRLFPRLSLGLEALYRPLHYRLLATFRDGVIGMGAREPVVTFEFPVLAKYKFALGRVRPFLEGGPSFRTAGNLNSANPSHFGVNAGVGLEMQWRSIGIAPKVRYTRWAEDGPAADVRTRSDQLEFLVGFSYAAASNAHPLGRRISLGAVVGPDVSGGAESTTFTGIYPWLSTPITTETFRGPGRLVIGPLVELSVSRRFSIEGNALSRSRHYNTVVTGGPAQVARSSSSWAEPWEFPVLAKYRLSTGSIRPFLALGPSFRLPKELGGSWLSNYGATAGAGVEFPLKMLKIAPTVRYTRWGPDRPRFEGGVGNSGEPRNRVHVLVGVSF
jgi:hypothetical protein